MLKRAHFINFFRNLIYRLKIRFAKTDVEEGFITHCISHNKDVISKDCVICFGQFQFFCLCEAAYCDAKTKILWVHSFFDESMKKEFGINLNKKKYIDVYRCFDKIFCVSKAVKDGFDREFPMYVSKTSVVYNLIDVNEIKANALVPIADKLKSISLLTVGRLSHEKGQHMIPAITRKLLNDGYEIFWYLIGGLDNSEKEIHREIKKHRVEDNVILLGTIQNPLPYMKQCDIYVQPSLIEGYCTATNEARILCKPIVATNITSMYEQFENMKNGILVDCNISAIYNGLKFILDNPSIKEQFAAELSKLIIDNDNELKKIYEVIN